jgi:hypothetical protein
LEEGINGPGWLFFSGFSVSRLKAVDGLRLPIRVEIEDGLFVIKMVPKIHEMMHTSIMLVTAFLTLAIENFNTWFQWFGSRSNAGMSSCLLGGGLFSRSTDSQFPGKS